MKTQFSKAILAIILSVVSLTMFAQTKQEQKRLKAIEKSIKEKDVEVYDDTAYYNGKAVCLIDKSVPFLLKNRKRVLLGIKSGKKLVTMTVPMIGTFKLEFEGVNDAGVIQENDFSTVTRFLLDEGIIKDGELDANAANSYVSKNTCISFGLENASLSQFYITVGTKTFLLNGQSLTECAGKAGDRVLMYVNNPNSTSPGSPLSSVTIDKTTRKISINSPGTALVVQ